MSQELKLVKYACFLSLAVGILGAVGFIYAVATGADLVDSLLVLAVALDAAVFGFRGARIANVPSDVPAFKKEVAWAPLLGLVVIGDFWFLDPNSNLVLSIVAYAGFIALVLLEIAVLRASNKIEKA